MLLQDVLLRPKFSQQAGLGPAPSAFPAAVPHHAAPALFDRPQHRDVLECCQHHPISGWAGR